MTKKSSYGERWVSRCKAVAMDIVELIHVCADLQMNIAG